MRRRDLALGIGGVMAFPLIGWAQKARPADSNAKILAPSGKLRAALYPGTPTSILDAKESDPRGVGYELGRRLRIPSSRSYTQRTLTCSRR